MLPLTTGRGDDSRSRHLQLVQWSPTGNALAFIAQNNIYYRPSAASDSNIYAITSDGSELIYNGITDWVYEGHYKIKVPIITCTVHCERKMSIMMNTYDFRGTVQLKCCHVVFPYVKASRLCLF